MKKLYLLASLLTGSILSNAQIKKGDVLLGGDISIYNGTLKTDDGGSSNTSSKTTILTFSPSFGEVVKDNLVVGFDLTYSHLKTSNDPMSTPTTNKNNTFGAGIFIRDYKYLGSGFSLFGESKAGFSYGDTKTYNSTGQSNYVDAKQLAVNLGFSPGVAYTISKRWQLEMAFPNVLYANYNHYRETNTVAGQQDTHTTTNSFSMGSSLDNTVNLNVGLRYLIAAK